MKNWHFACAWCGRKSLNVISSEWFAIFICKDCGQEFCDCDGPPCPACKSSNCIENGRIYGL